MRLMQQLAAYNSATRNNFVNPTYGQQSNIILVIKISLPLMNNRPNWDDRPD